MQNFLFDIHNIIVGMDKQSKMGKDEMTNGNIWIRCNNITKRLSG